MDFNLTLFYSPKKKNLTLFYFLFLLLFFIILNLSFVVGFGCGGDEGGLCGLQQFCG